MIGVELLSKLMDNLPEHGFILFSVDRKSLRITHLCYADDTILFSFGDSYFLKLMMSKLEAYEVVSGQMVNKQKSGFYVSARFTDDEINEFKNITGFLHC